MAFVSLVLAIVAIAIASKGVRTTAIVALVVGLLSMAASGAVLLEEWRQVHNDAAQWWDDAAQEEASAPGDL
jgi:hypothetical protein